MAQKGYNGVTTREIAAAAGVNEVTLFRHFGSKQKLLEAAFERFHYSEDMKKLFQEQIVWDLQADLTLISRTYHAIMQRNRNMYKIAFKEADQLPGFLERANQSPKQLKMLLTEYFGTMAEKGKLIHTNPELQAVLFMFLNFGAFVSSLYGDDSFPVLAKEEFIEENVRLFVRALTP